VVCPQLKQSLIFRVTVILVTLFCGILFADGSMMITSYALNNTCGSTCSVSVSPDSGIANTQFDINTQVTVPAFTPSLLFLVAVITPSGATYACSPAGACFSIRVHPGPTVQIGSCTIPFGVAGTLTGSAFDCSGSNSVWVEQTVLGGNPLATLESDCTSLSGGFLNGPDGVGSTLETGIYTVISCWLSPNGINGLYSETTFSVTNIGVTPEFPMGTVVALTIPFAGLFVYTLLIEKSRGRSRS
jgi:hypothetical protein